MHRKYSRRCLGDQGSCPGNLGKLRDCAYRHALNLELTSRDLADLRLADPDAILMAASSIAAAIAFLITIATYFDNKLDRKVRS